MCLDCNTVFFNHLYTVCLVDAGHSYRSIIHSIYRSSSLILKENSDTFSLRQIRVLYTFWRKTRQWASFWFNDVGNYFFHACSEEVGCEKLFFFNLPKLRIGERCPAMKANVWVHNNRQTPACCQILMNSGKNNYVVSWVNEIIL